MDEMSIVSKFTTGLISKIMSGMLKKQLGYNVKVNLNQVKMTVKDGDTHLHIDCDADINSQDLLGIIKKAGF